MRPLHCKQVSRTPSAQQIIEETLVTAIFDDMLDECLPIEDSCIRLNSIATAVSGLASLQAATSNDALAVQCLGIISRELDRLMDAYERVLEAEVKEMTNRYVVRNYAARLQDVFFSAKGNIIEITFESRYTIDGGEMESRAACNEVMQVTSSLIDENSLFHNVIRPHLCFSIHHEVNSSVTINSIFKAISVTHPLISSGPAQPRSKYRRRYNRAGAEDRVH